MTKLSLRDRVLYLCGQPWTAEFIAAILDAPIDDVDSALITLGDQNLVTCLATPGRPHQFIASISGVTALRAIREAFVP